ncbi:ATP-dependent sacrificial sulfur transferase LarE [Desulforhopalus sp. IMCC35007]|uniref:ATP-dependent sacrificial sulfur transferase LarE n=1 Tax=Desulforhopalus sp. IMCC35007 TaxID=2569543 RepID=UPI0010AE7954|nr:ATP-dependent sacrificial sulfur transferase LarE [Desulforhopalus sp. IMCC35007]TKB09313.1 ATP-dependent sacrificial sulfur transferase LarE [Desulforhopalus sp. IMCC35007]
MGLENEKYENLRNILSAYGRVAVAFSGGIDSTFLLFSAIDALGPANVLAYNCMSELNSQAAVSSMKGVFQHHFEAQIPLRVVKLYPRTWKEFVANSDKRCYFCKKRMYTILLDEIKKESCFILAEGTNIDDLKSNRPGLRAIRELNIKTPLVEAGFTKREIRILAEKKGLINHGLASNSCLATRVRSGQEITLQNLAVIEKAEEYLRKLGFLGCRVKVDGTAALVEINRCDFEAFVKDEVRSAVLYTFYKLGLASVSLDLSGR